MPPKPTGGQVSRSEAGRHSAAPAGTARSGPADRRCWWATCTPRTSATPSTTKATSAPAISARWVDDDYLVVTGRAKDIIIRNGENISPKEIEDILIGHPDIAEIAIVGLPDARTGERACAVIVPRPCGRRTRRREPARPSRRPGRREVQSSRTSGDLGRPAQERRGQGAQASDPGGAWRRQGADMQVAIVTGASSGIGFACATKLAEMGMAVVGTGRDETGSPNWRRRSAIPTGWRPSPST